jgi:hypothetical protein
VSGAKRVDDVVWCVTRVLCGGAEARRHGFGKVPRGTVFTVVEDGLERKLDGGEWIQHSSDGAIGEVVGEYADQMAAQEWATKLASDYPGREYRVCASVVL